MKKPVLVLLAIILCVSMVGCGGNKTANADNTASPVQNEEVSESKDENDEASSSEQKTEIQSAEESTAEVTEDDTSNTTRESKNGFDESTNRDVLFNGCSIAIPEYFGENNSNNDDSLSYFLETGRGVTMLSAETANYDKSEEEYKKEEDAIVMQVLTNMSKGITVDLENSDIKNRHYYGSVESDGTTVGLEFETRPLYLGDMIMILTLVQSDESEYDYFSDFDKIVNSVKRLEEESGSNDSEDNDGRDIDPDFKKTMDDYEAFFDEYVKFMKKYQENPSDLALLGEMADMLQKENEMMDNFNNIDQDELNPAELSYYVEVQSRILKKLSEVY